MLSTTLHIKHKIDLSIVGMLLQQRTNSFTTKTSGHTEVDFLFHANFCKTASKQKWLHQRVESSTG